MKRYLLATALFIATTCTYGQQRLSKIDTKDLSDEQLEQIDQLATQDGWVLIMYNGNNYVNNFSNPDYFLRMQLKCMNDQPPGFLIEYSNNYRDGDYGGIDFLAADDGDNVHFWVDGKNFKNAFAKSEEANFPMFFAALKKGKTLTVDVLNDRKIVFKLANPEYLDIAVECSPKREAKKAVDDDEVEAMIIAE